MIGMRIMHVVCTGPVLRLNSQEGAQGKRDLKGHVPSDQRFVMVLQRPVPDGPCQERPKSTNSGQV
jgi:hypothetical protein